MKFISRFLFFLLCVCLSGIAFASSYSTYVINRDSENHSSGDILIDYTICTDSLEKNPTCSAHEKLRILRNYPKKIKLNSQNEILYIWHASTYDSTGHLIENDYSKNIQNVERKLHTVSDCATSDKKVIVLDTYGTKEIISCQIVISG